MYSPNNNTDENIQEYLHNKQKSMYMNNSFQNAENSLSLLPYNSMPLSQYQIGAYQLSNNFNSQYEVKHQNYNNNNLSTNEINLETNNEPNLNNDTEQNTENKINNNENKKEERPKKEDKVKEKVDEGDEEVLSALSEESNNEKEYDNHLLAQYESVKRIKNKWKVNLKGCIAQKDNMEYVCGKLHGELSREW